MAGFFQQLKSLIWRNVLLKSRNKGQVFQELFFPVYFVALLALIRILVKPDTKPMQTFPPHNVNSTDFGQSFSSHEMIYAAPNTSQYSHWMEDIVSQLNGPPQYTMFTSEADAEAAYKKNFKDVKFGVIFNYHGNPNAYAIRIGFKDIPSPKDIFYFREGTCRETDNATSSKNCQVNKYMTSGFVQLQIAIETTLMTNLSIPSTLLSSRQTYVQMMELDEYDPDTSYIQTISAIYFVFSFCILASYVAINIVAEKEKKIKDGMMMMGLNSNVFWLSWAVIYIGMVVVSSVIMIGIIVATKFFKESSMLLLFFMFILYGASFIALGFMITPFFNKARVAGAVAGFSTVFISLLHLIVTETRDQGSYDSNIPVWSQWLMCLLSPLAFSTCIDKALFLDIRMGGFHFDDSLTYGKFPLYAPIVMLVVDTLLYSLLIFYFDKAVPGEYGVRYKPYFFLQPSYWSSSKMEGDTERLVVVTRTEPQTSDVEPVSSNMDNRLAMKISSISKSFVIKKEVTYAVNDFSLDIYEGQITCLLGHNGAGKTTLMNILTGIIPPSSGTAKIMGLDITVPEEMVRIRKSCGICPQHNILYDCLSCKEHLRIFADIKGIPSHHRESTVLQALRDVDLENQGDTFAKDLSGGQKRKLSVAIALIGDPKLIFLDEPTAALDPYSRRHLWSLLKKRKEGRIILLTTHFMDEADILSDRKAFIQKGKLRCCGSSLFLKNKFGIGYHLTMVVDPACNVEKLTSFLTAIIPGILHQRSHGKEVAYIVPLNDVSKFSVLFGKLDESSSALGIKSYGVSMTTLEEVFLKLEGEDEETKHHRGCDRANEQNTETAIFPKDLVVSEKELLKQQFMTLLRIRFLCVIRKKKALFMEIFIPVCLVFAGLLIIKTKRVDSSPHLSTLPISVDMYANSSMDPIGFFSLPGLLVFDSLNTSISQDIISGWKERFEVDLYTTRSTNTLDVKSHYVGIQLNEITGQLLPNFVVLYNNTALHSIPAAISLVTQTLLQASNISAYINVSTYPWPNIESKSKVDSQTFVAGMMVGLAFILIIPGFSSEVVRDRELKLRSQLRISGVSFNIYWGSIYVMNFAIYLIPSFLIIIMILVLQIEGLKSAGALGALLLLFFFNIPFLCFFALILSFIFNKTDNCTSYLPFILNIAAILPYIVVSTVDMVSDRDASIILHYIFCVIDPPYIILGGFYFIARFSMFAVYSGEYVDDASYFDPDNHTLVAILMPIVHTLWMYWLLRVLDVLKTGGKMKEAFPCFSKSLDVSEASNLNQDVIENEDTDVKAERLRVDAFQCHVTERYTSTVDMVQISPKEPVAYTKHLRKNYIKRKEKKTCSKPGKSKTKVAVRNLSFGVNEGEVLGLLGPNGAGKTTALNMIIAETEPTCGKVVVGGHDIRSGILNMALVGYCPQHDALWDVITLREHIICFAAIKGVPSNATETVVDFYVSNMKLEEHKMKAAQKLSGGTKRKLSYILSLLGNPDLVLMDEPSTGMDPQSKRFFWDTISSTFRDTDKGAILTTHYMEEADALCSRVGIMVNGQLQCLGSTQHLKDRFGSGYILEVKLMCIQSSEIEESMNKLEDHLREHFPDMEQVERFMERAQYAIPKENVKSLGATFANLENCKQSHQLEEYNFSQSSLEQVFLYFAKKQIDDLDSESDADSEELPHENMAQNV